MENTQKPKEKITHSSSHSLKENYNILVYFSMHIFFQMIEIVYFDDFVFSFSQLYQTHFPMLLTF